MADLIGHLLAIASVTGFPRKSSRNPWQTERPHL